MSEVLPCVPCGVSYHAGRECKDRLIFVLGPQQQSLPVYIWTEIKGSFGCHISLPSILIFLDGNVRTVFDVRASASAGPIFPPKRGTCFFVVFAGEACLQLWCVVCSVCLLSPLF